MYKLIGADAQGYSPVSAEQIRQWLAEGRVSSETKVQVKGEGEWKQVADIGDGRAEMNASRARGAVWGSMNRRRVMSNG